MGSYCTQSSRRPWRDTKIHGHCCHRAVRVLQYKNGYYIKCRAKCKKREVPCPSLMHSIGWLRIGSYIRELSRELLRLALDFSGYRSIRLKILMRSDQFADPRLFDFQDASKLKTAAVRLEWKRWDLYGLLFYQIWNDPEAQVELIELIDKVAGRTSRKLEFPDFLREDADIQAKLFSQIAGQFMGSDRRRGRTYSWLQQHLADAFEQTSPRSFLLAVHQAALVPKANARTAIDYVGIKGEVVEASRGRVDELKEDNIWIAEAIGDLAELEVPTEPRTFIARWKAKRTVEKIDKIVRQSDRPGPLAFDEGVRRGR